MNVSNGEIRPREIIAAHTNIPILKLQVVVNIFNHLIPNPLEKQTYTFPAMPS